MEEKGENTVSSHVLTCPGSHLSVGSQKQSYRSTNTQNLKEIKKEMFNLFNARTSHFMPMMSVIALSAMRLFGFSNQGGGVFLMGFFSSAIDGLKTVITAIGAGIGVWGVINLLEGYGNDNAGSKSQGIKQLMAGGGIIILAQTVIPLLSSLFGGGGGEGGGEG